MITVGPTNDAVSDGFVRWLLVPALRVGDLVVMDNHSSHKTAGLVEAAEAAGTTICYLRPYSPDLNPINIFSKIKAWLRSVQAQAQVTPFEPWRCAKKHRPYRLPHLFPCRRLRRLFSFSFVSSTLRRFIERCRPRRARSEG
jgi:transposase